MVSLRRHRARKKNRQDIPVGVVIDCAKKATDMEDVCDGAQKAIMVDFRGGKVVDRSGPGPNIGNP